MREYIYNNPFNWDEDSPTETDDLIGLFEDSKSRKISRGKENTKNLK